MTLPPRRESSRGQETSPLKYGSQPNLAGPRGEQQAAMKRSKVTLWFDCRSIGRLIYELSNEQEPHEELHSFV